MSISIITPIFNRANIVNNLYTSLLRQNSYDFEWIIVDDGSTDNIKQVINSFQKESPFSIKLISKINGGKHTAINLGVEVTAYQWIFIVDSDDYISDDAISSISSDLKSIQDDNCAGLIYLKAYSSSKLIIGSGFPKEKIFNEDLAASKGDKAIIFRRGLIDKNPFPEYKNEKFVTEAYLWNSILQRSYLLYHGKVVYFAEYLEGGLSDNYKSLLARNEKGTLHFVVSNLQLQKKGINIYKQTVYHFLPIFSVKNLMAIKSKTSLCSFILFSSLTLLAEVKKLITGIKPK